MNVVRLELPNYPLIIHCVENGTVAFTPQGRFTTIFDQENNTIVDPDFLNVEGHILEWGTMYEYKLMPYLKDWLVKQELVSPL